MSRSVRDPDYRHPGYTVVTLHRCHECATLTPDPPQPDGIYLCERHKK